MVSQDVPRINEKAADSTASSDLEYVKSSLKITTTELARYLGVSRQSIYLWRSGSHIKSHNIVKLENLKRAADVIAASDFQISGLHLARKLPGGLTLLENIGTGSDGREAAKSLINMLQREGLQRNALRQRFAGRKPTTDSHYDGSVAVFRENG